MHSHIDVLNCFRTTMGAGGDAPSVPIWDMAVLAGATLFLSTLVIVSPWTQPETYALDGKEEVLSIHTGISQAGLTFESSCVGALTSDAQEDEASGSCETLSIWIIPHDGEESWGGSLDDAEEIILLNQGDSESNVDTNNKLDTGEYRLILDGEGQYTFEATVNRTIPHEFVPAIIGSLLLVWGIWRKQQEDDSN